MLTCKYLLHKSGPVLTCLNLPQQNANSFLCIIKACMVWALVLYFWVPLTSLMLWKHYQLSTSHTVFAEQSQSDLLPLLRPHSWWLSFRLQVSPPPKCLSQLPLTPLQHALSQYPISPVELVLLQPWLFLSSFPIRMLVPWEMEPCLSYLFPEPRTD